MMFHNGTELFRRVTLDNVQAYNKDSAVCRLRVDVLPTFGGNG